MGQKIKFQTLVDIFANYRWILQIYTSRGSIYSDIVKVRCAFSNHCIKNFPQNVPVKKNENRSIFGKYTDKILRLTFLDHPEYCRLSAEHAHSDGGQWSGSFYLHAGLTTRVMLAQERVVRTSQSTDGAVQTCTNDHAMLRHTSKGAAWRTNAAVLVL